MATNKDKINPLDLIVEISEALKVSKDERLKAEIITISHDLLLIEFPNGQRFRLLIQDCERFS